MALLSVFEYQRVRVGESSGDDSTPCITRTQADILTNQKARLGFEVFKFVNGSAIAAQQYVGVCQVGDLTVEVLPKIDVEVSHVRKNLVAMIAATVDMPIKDGGELLLVPRAIASWKFSSSFFAGSCLNN